MALPLLLTIPMAGGRGQGGIVTITFDDGYENVYKYAYPLMKSYSYRGVVFMVAGRIGGLHGGYQLMDVGELSELAGEGWDICSHTVSHPHLDMVSPERLRYELEASRMILSGVGFQPAAVAYPGGAYNRDVVVEASKYYYFGRTLEPGINMPRMSLELKAVVLQEDNTEYVEWWIEEASRSGGWLIIVLHGVVPDGEELPPPVMGWNHVGSLARILEAIRERGLTVLTFTDVLEMVQPTDMPCCRVGL